MARKDYLKNLNIFKDLEKMPSREMSARIDVIQGMINRREEEIRKAKESARKVRAEFEKFKQMLEGNGSDELEAKMEQIVDEYEQNAGTLKEDDELEAEEGDNEVKSKTLEDYNRLSDKKLVEEGKRIFVYSMIKDELNEAKMKFEKANKAKEARIKQAQNVLEQVRRMKRLDQEQRIIEEYFDKYEKKTKISFKDKEEYAKMEKIYNKLLEEKRAIPKMTIVQARLQLREARLQSEEDKIMRQEGDKIEYLTNKDNWTEIVGKLQKRQEMEEKEREERERQEREEREIEDYDEEPSFAEKHKIIAFLSNAMDRISEFGSNVMDKINEIRVGKQEENEYEEEQSEGSPFEKQRREFLERNNERNDDEDEVLIIRRERDSSETKKESTVEIEAKDPEESER